MALIQNQAIATAIPGATGVIVNSCIAYMGLTVKNTSITATASFQLTDGSGGTIIEEVTLLANESDREWYGPLGKACGSIWLNLISGTIEGSVFHV